MLRKSLSSAGLLLTASIALAQSQGPVYQYMPNVTVTAYDSVQSMPFCGGLNNPQFTMGDLNNDGLQDLVVFENNVGLKTFINTGKVNGAPKYVYEPKYELNFPPCTTYLNLTDYNCDGIPDLFTQISLAGFVAYKGYYNTNNELCFGLYRGLYYHNDGSSGDSVNAYVGINTDVPAIVDNNNDGAPDFFAFQVGGCSVTYYKNLRALGGFSCDTIAIEAKTFYWGKFSQGYYQTHFLHTTTCIISDDSLKFPHYDNQAYKVTDGANSLCLFDYDGDGDYDYLDGSNQHSEMTLLINGRIEKGSGPDSMIAQDTTFPSGGEIVQLSTQPSAFNIDIDQDGKKDLLISPHAAGTSSENYKCVWFYKNGTTPGHPSWTFKSDTMLIDQMIDVGTAAYPAFFDYDKDGKPDLFIGSDGYYQSSGLLLGKVAYYHNTSTPGHPSFKLVTKDFLDISAQLYQGTSIAFGDLNNDGRTDMVLGHKDGTISFYQNLATSNNITPEWVPSGSLTDSSGAPIDKGSQYAAPFIYDVNKDGRPDLIVGGDAGTLHYYENHSTKGANINLVLKTGKLGNIQIDGGGLDAYSTPFIGKMDNTGKDYLLVGSNSGRLYRYAGFENGTVPTHFQMIDSQYSFIDSTIFKSGYSYREVRSAPAIADIDGDGKYELVIGSVTGGLKIYEQMYNVTDLSTMTVDNSVVNAFPNPAKDVININWTREFAGQDISIIIYNALGQKIAEKMINSSQSGTQITLPGIPDGIYFAEVVSGNNRSTLQLAILK